MALLGGEKAWKDLSQNINICHLLKSCFPSSFACVLFFFILSNVL
jgi:hypothetical protein